MSSVIAYETNKHKWMMENSSFHSKNYDNIILTINDNPSSVSSPNNFSEWGPKRDPLYIVIPVTVIYTVIFLTGVIGNISTCIVIAKNKSMHTATNYYLFSLAVSDLLLLVCGLPPEIYLIWSKFPYVFGEAFCVLQGFAAETSANATVLTITAFTIERYVAICHPFLSHTMSKLSRAIKFVMAIWLVAMCLAIPQAMSFGIVYATTPDGHQSDEHNACVVKRVIIPHAFEISTFLFFIAPMSLITVLYVLIGLQLRRTALRGGNNNGGPHRSSVRLRHRQQRSTPPLAQTVVIVTPGEEADIEDRVEISRDEDGRKNFPRNAQQNATRHVVKMLVAVVVAFFVCWAPFHAQRLLAIYGDPDHSSAMIVAFRILTYVSGVLYYLSTTVNPLLYHIMSHKFREAFKATFAQCLQCCIPRDREKCYSTLSGRSSQVNSHSGNTDSQCSRQSSLRYLDSELTTRRPLVVSFRRPPTSRDRINHNEYITRINHSNGRFRYGNSFLSLEPDLQKTQHDIKNLKEKKISMLDTDYDDLYRINDPYTNGHCFPTDDLLEPEVFICPKSPFQKKSIPDDLFHVKFQQKSDFSRFLEDQNHYDGCRIDPNKIEQKDYDSDCDFHLFSTESPDFTSLEIQNLLPAHICPLTFKNSQEHKHDNHKKKKHRHHHRQNKDHLTIPKSHTTSNINELNGNGNVNLKPSDNTLSVNEKSSSFSCLASQQDGAGYNGPNGGEYNGKDGIGCNGQDSIGYNGQNCLEYARKDVVGYNGQNGRIFTGQNDGSLSGQNGAGHSIQYGGIPAEENCGFCVGHGGGSYAQHGGYCCSKNGGSCTGQNGGTCTGGNVGGCTGPNGPCFIGHNSLNCIGQNGPSCIGQNIPTFNVRNGGACIRQNAGVFAGQNGGTSTGQNGGGCSGQNGGGCSGQNGLSCIGQNGSSNAQNGGGCFRQNGGLCTGQNGGISTGQNGGISTGQNGGISTGKNGGISIGQNDGGCSRQNNPSCTEQNGSSNAQNSGLCFRQNGGLCAGQNGGMCTGQNGGSCIRKNGGNCNAQNIRRYSGQNIGSNAQIGGVYNVQNIVRNTGQNGGIFNEQTGSYSGQTGGDFSLQKRNSYSGQNSGVFNKQKRGSYSLQNDTTTAQNVGSYSRQNGGDTTKKIGENLTEPNLNVPEQNTGSFSGNFSEKPREVVREPIPGNSSEQSHGNLSEQSHGNLSEQSHGNLSEPIHGTLSEQTHGTLSEQTHGTLREQTDGNLSEKTRESFSEQNGSYNEQNGGQLLLVK